MPGMQVDPPAGGPGQSACCHSLVRTLRDPLTLLLGRSSALDKLFADDDLKAMLPKMDNATEESMGDLSNPMVMRTYYSRLLPWKAMFLWLNQSHVPTRQFTHREFAFTLQNEAYLRYQSFAGADELKQEVLRLNPSRFEIGPMYSGRVSLRRHLPSRNCTR